ncbi:MAG: efflux RND transporter permease subunit [Candidatus Margulisiibacteriota bacterium]
MIKFFVNRPLFTLAVYLIFVIIGFFCLNRLPLDFMPDISIPTLTIITTYPGASAEDIETSVSKVIEDAVATVPNVDRITSDSVENVSTVTLSFKWGSNLDAASADVRDKMDLASGKLPRDVESPTIFKFDLSQIPVLVIGLSADESFRDLYSIADKKISNDLKRVPGVGTVIISGGLERQINVDVDRNRLEAYHLSIGQLNQAITASNLSMPAGSIKSGSLEYGIRVPGEYKNIEEIKNTIVGSYNGMNIYVSDVADVSDSFKEESNMTEVDGRQGVMLQIQKQSGANTVVVVDEARKHLAALEKELPPDVKITYVQDTSEFIKQQISELSNTLYFSFLFVALTVLFFLRNFRGSIVICLAIPFSIIAAFVYMYFSGGSVNIISLASIIISVGVVVDNAIVMLENIYRHHQEDKRGLKDAAITAAHEVGGALLASTTTSVIIFVPLLLVSGFVGVFFNQLAAISIVVISMSLIIALTFTPVASSVILKEEEGPARGWIRVFHDRSEKMFNAVECAYQKTLCWCISKRRIVIIACVVIFFASMPLFMLTGSQFFPDQDTGFISGTVTMPPGTRWEKTADAIRKIEAEVKAQVPELEFILVTAGSSSARMSLATRSGPNYGRFYLKVVPLSQRKRDIKQIQKVVSDIAFAVPGLKAIDFSESGANQMAGSGKPVTIEIYGADFEIIDAVADELKDKISAVRGVIEPNISREKANPEFTLKVDRDKASSLGLTMYDIGQAARDYLYGSTVSKYREGGDEYDIFVRLKEGSRSSLDDIRSVYITNRMGQNISLGNIAEVIPLKGPQVIQRKNQQRYVYVEADNIGRPLGDVISDVRKIIAKMDLPPNITVKIAGQAEQMQESFRSLFIAMLLGIALIYLVMVAQFESFLDPFIIMFSVPFAIIGVIWALFITGTPFGIMPFVGMILVTGVAVNNSIVLVDYINQLREKGKPLEEAVPDAGQTRLRPILMTTATTMLGLLPIMLGTGEGSRFWQPMAISVFGGLLISATVSLFLVPTVYFVAESRLRRKKPDLKAAAVILLVLLLGGSSSALTLEQSRLIALENNPSIAAARENLSVSRAQAGQAKAALLPQVSLGANYGNSFSTLVTLPKSPSDLTSYSLTVTQTLFTGGQLIQAMSIADITADTVELELKRVVEDINYNAARAYFDVLKAEKSVAIIKDSADILRRNLKQSELFFGSGIGSMSSVLRIKTQLANLELAKIVAENSARLARLALGAVLGKEVADSEVLEEPVLEGAAPVAFTKEQALEVAFENRPEWISFQLGIKAGEKGVSAAYGAYFPSILYTYTTGRTISNYPKAPAYNSDIENWQSLLVASWNIFDGFSTASKIWEARAMLASAKEQERSLHDAIVLEVDSAYYTLKAAQQGLAVATIAAELAEKTLKTTEINYRANITSELEYLDAQNSYRTAQNNYWTAKYDLEIARAGLNKLVGKNLF